MNYTIEEMEKAMTLFYSKRTGEIKSYATGIQSMNYFGEDLEDFELIYGHTIVEKDEYVLNNISMFVVNEGRVLLKDQYVEILQKYTIPKERL